MKLTIRPLHLVALISFAVTVYWSFGQGSLTPPGAPVPTMKSLDEIEPRTNVQRTINPLPNDANYHYIISQPGSYYLSANLDVTKTGGIHVTVAGVTIDLNGFQISRSSGSGGDGIVIDPTAERCTVQNGSLAGLGNGVRCAQSFGTSAHGGAFLNLSVSGCSAEGVLWGGKGWRIDGCTAYGNSGGPIIAGEGSVISNCTAFDNQITNGVSAILGSSGCTLTNCTARNNLVTYAIFGGYGSTLINCTASNNKGIYGIAAQSGTLTNCSALSNSGTDTSSGGIGAFNTCTIIGCTAVGNQNTNATATNATGVGIDAGEHSTVRNCTAVSNKGDGIRMTNRCFVSECTSNNNGAGGVGDGIHSTGVNNRIDSNVAHTNSGIGIHASTTADYIVRNIANGNGGGNYNPASGTYVGPFQTPGTATSPWANF